MLRNSNQYLNNHTNIQQNEQKYINSVLDVAKLTNAYR